MERKLFDRLKRMYGYSTWRDRNTLAENLFVWRYYLDEDILPGWQPQRIQEVSIPAPSGPRKGAAARARLAGYGPRAIRSVWTRPDDPTRAVLSIDVFECVSRVAAHEYLVRILGEFQLPLIEQPEDMEVGDVAFQNQDGTVAILARANLVYVIANAGRVLVPVGDIARTIDEKLVAKPEIPEAPEPGERPIATEVLRFSVLDIKPRVGAKTALDVEAAHPEDKPLMYKFFSRAGEVYRDKERLIYKPALPGAQDVMAYAVAPDSAAREVVNLSAEHADEDEANLS